MAISMLPERTAQKKSLPMPLTKRAIVSISARFLLSLNNLT